MLPSTQAGTHVRFYRADDAYLIIGVQVMDHHGTGKLNDALRTPLIRAFQEAWRG